MVGCLSRVPTQPSFNQTFNQEDEWIMKAYDALDNNDEKAAKAYFQEAYNLTKNKSYLKEIVGILVIQRDFEEAKTLALEYLKQNPKDEEVRAALIGILTSLKDFSNAQKETEILLAQSDNPQNLEIASSVFFLQKEYQKSVRFLEKAYALEKSAEILDKWASIELLFLNNKTKAIQLYETHHRLYGLTGITGEKLGAIYLDEGRYKEAAKVYEKLFDEFGEQIYAKRALEIYFKTNLLDLAQKFLESHSNIETSDEILLEIYRTKKENTKLITTLQRLYLKTQNPDYLAWEAMLLYETTPKKNRKVLTEVAKKLKEAIVLKADALYYNYLGYLLIDHDMNLKEGLEYVQKALEKEPENPYYLDSLAWGYYKLKDCLQAQEVIEKIPQKERVEEILEHYDLILKCQKGKQ